MDQVDAQANQVLTYTLNLKVSSYAVSNVVVTDTLPSGVSYVGPGVNNPASLPDPTLQPNGTLLWNIPVLDPGTYQLQYQTKVNAFIQGGIVLMNNAQMSFQGVTLSSSVGVTTSGDYTVKLGIYNEAGELVKEIVITQYSEPIENITLLSSNAITAVTGTGSTVGIYYDGVLIGTWDGTNTAGQEVANGNYYVKVDNETATGTDISTTQDVTVDRTMYQVAVDVYNSAGEVVAHLYDYVGNAGQTMIGSMNPSTSSIETGSSASGATTQVDIELSNGTTVIWSGDSDSGVPVASGIYYVEVTSEDGSGGQSVLTGKITVLNGGTVSGIAAVPNMLKEGSTPSMATSFVDENPPAGDPTPDAKIMIYTMAGELLKRFDAPLNTSQATWNASGLASGLYLAVIEEKSTEGGIVSRKILKIAVIH